MSSKKKVGAEACDLVIGGAALKRDLEALAASLAVLEPGPLRVYFAEIWGESDFWRGILAGMRARNPQVWAEVRGTGAAPGAVLGRWAALLPEDSGACLVRAERLRKDGRCDDALGEARKALRLDAGFLPARAVIAKLLLSVAAAAGHRALLRGARRIKAECRRAMADNRCLWAYNLLQFVLCAENRNEEAYPLLAELVRRHPNQPELLVNLAIQEFGSDFESSAERVKKALALRPGWTILYAFRGELLRLMGRPDEALADFDFVVRERPDYEQAYLWRSKVRRGRREYAEALRDVDRALALEPSYSRSHFERFQISLEVGELRDALASLERAEVLESSCPWNAPHNELVTGWRYRRFGLLCRLKRYDDALACLEVVRREDLKYTWSFGGQQAAVQEARRQLDEAVRRRPSNPWFRAWRGQTALASGDLVQARRDLDAALRLDSRPAWFHAWRGELNLRIDRIDACLADLKRAARAKGCRARVEGLRAEAGLRRGRWAEALRHARRAARLDPSGVGALIAMARAWRGLSRLGPARAVLESARRLAPGDSGVLALIAEFDMRESFFPFDIVSGESPAASGAGKVSAVELAALYARQSEELKGQLRSAPKVALARTHAERGWVSHCAGEHPRALVDLNQAVALDPANAVYNVWRGRVHGARGRWEEARRDFTAALAKEPRAARAFLERARALRKMGRRNEALADVRAAAALGPRD